MNQNYDTETHPTILSGRIIRTRPLANTGVNQGSEVQLIVSLGHICATRRVRIYQGRDPHAITHVPPHARMPGHDWGNRDFSGNGPDVLVQVDVYVEGNRLKSQIYMSATETKRDWTAAIGTRTGDVLYIPGPGWQIMRIVERSVDVCQYRDNDHGIETCSFSARSGPVEKMEIKGDGGGDDAGRHTHVKVFFNPDLQVDLIETGNCVSP